MRIISAAITMALMCSILVMLISTIEAGFFLKFIMAGIGGLWIGRFASKFHRGDEE